MVGMVSSGVAVGLLEVGVCGCCCSTAAFEVGASVVCGGAANRSCGRVGVRLDRY